MQQTATMVAYVTSYRFLVLLVLALTMVTFVTVTQVLPEASHHPKASARHGAPLSSLGIGGEESGPGAGDADAARTGTTGLRPDLGPPLKVAYAVTITKDGPYLDGAAVLKHSIDMLPSRHNVEMVAIVHPDVQTTRPALVSLGFRLFEFEAPIKSSEIKGKHLRETIDKSGCCGALELLKYRAYQLVQYDRVVLLDMDAIIVKSLDHLFDSPKEAQFTYDHGMDGGGAAPPVQGGFLLLRPSERTFQNMIDIVREGDFRPGTGWAGSHIGWCWGGQSFQGLTSYYYNRVDPSNKVVLDYCRFNAMASPKDCEPTPFDEVYSAHFTVCQKPWDCRVSDKPLCREMIRFWWTVRKDLERKLGLPISTMTECKSKRDYTKLKLAGTSQFT